MMGASPQGGGFCQRKSKFRLWASLDHTDKSCVVFTETQTVIIWIKADCTVSEESFSTLGVLEISLGEPRAGSEAEGLDWT